jgi:putative endopeptidase
MLKNVIVILLFFGSSLTFAVEPSSDIPAQRDFPLNEKINPCDDFHKYVCSEAEAAFKLRDDRSRHTFSFNDSSERILLAKKDFFAHINEQKKLNARSQQIKDNYLACMNEKTAVENEKTEIKKLVSEISRIKTPEEFATLQVTRMKKGESSLINFDAYSNQDNPKINDIFIFVDMMNLPENSYYDNKELMVEYKKLIVDFFKITNPDLNETQLNAKADRLIDLEKQFVKVYPLPEVRRQRWSEKRQEKQSEFLAKYPNLQLKDFLAKTPKNILVSNPLPEALEFYNKALTADNLEALKDFFVYSYGRGILDDSNPEYFNKQFAFNNKYLGGPLTRSVRDERCTRKVMYTFPKELDQLIMQKLFPDFPVAKFKAIAQKIRESIIRGVKANTWLEPETKAKAVLKMEKAKLYLVKPETAREWDFIAVKKYSPTDQFANQRLYNQTGLAKKLKSLKEGANLEAWDMGPLTVNAYYDPSSNKFVMPMGILQYPFFNAKGDDIENLGAVGAVIGHELGHGIDDQGSRYDENGKLKQWMSMKDLKEFSERGRKLVDYFGKAGHNGVLTLGENIGDLVGLTFAYQAAFPDGKASQEDQKRLFVAYGRLWCTVARPKAEEQQLKTDPHALGWARINEQVKHQKAFAEAFNCKKGDKMYLSDEERVKIW